MAGGFFDLSTGVTVNQVAGGIATRARDVMLDIVKFDVFRAANTLTAAPWSLPQASVDDIGSAFNDLVHFQKIWAGVVQARNLADTAFETYDFQTFAKRLYGPR
jgi:hypothetical protein